MLKNEELIEEIYLVEMEFAQLAKQKGITHAFIHFADEEAVLNRNNQIISGKNSIKEYLLKNPSPSGSSLEWTPDFVKVSEAGDLAYTYGKYTYKYPDSLGQIKSSEGVFHTIWKKQKDGSWLYVWD